MLKQNDPIRKLVGVDKWHKAMFTGKDTTIVILDGNEGKPRNLMKFYYTDILGTQTKIGHAANVGQVAHEFAPDAKIWMLRANDSAYEWVRAHREEIDLINVSLAGIDGRPTPDYLRYEELGIPMICATGNDDSEAWISYPARYPFTLAVGATSRVGTNVAGYSNEGADIDCVTPSDIYIQRDDDKVWSISGTSFASPVACGLLACYIQWRKEQGLSRLLPEEARVYIHENCRDIEDEGFDYKSGWGLIYLPEIPVALPKEEISPMKIFLDPGHGGSDPGAVSKIKESQYTLSYALELGRVLKLLGFDIAYSRTADIDVSLATRCANANSWGADYFISVHFNAGGGAGIETFAISAGDQGEKLANAVQIGLINSTSAVDRGRKFANFQVLRDTNMPAILIEGGFVDNAVDAQKIATEDYKRKYIQGATKGICAATGVAWRDVYGVATTQPTATTDKDGYLLVRVLDSKAVAVQAQIIAMGYACRPLLLP